MSDTDFNPFEQYFDRSEALNILKTPARVRMMVNYSSNVADPRI